METTLNALFGVGGDGLVETMGTNSPFVPAGDPGYVFRLDQIRALQLWRAGIVGNNVLVQGPTGSGKSSLIEQFASRIEWPLWRYGCHGRSEYGELIGQITVQADGSTKFLYGPLPQAMINGGVLLMDEFNFLPPSVAGAMNTVLDGGSLLIAETGELIEPHPEFRIAATGNAIDNGADVAAYRGIQKMNMAMLQRFLVTRVDYMDHMEEAIVLNKACPQLPSSAIESLVLSAEDVRKATVNGDIETAMSTRTLVRVAKILEARLAVAVTDPMGELKLALGITLLNGISSDEAKAIEGVFVRRGISFIPGHAGVDDADASKVSGTRVYFTVNKNRQGTGKATYWGGILKDGQWKMFNGCFDDKTHRWVKDTAQQDEFTAKIAVKKNQRDYERVVDGLLAPDHRSTASDYLQKVIDAVGIGLGARGTGNEIELQKATLGPKAAEQVKTYLLSIGVSATVV